MVTRQGSVVLIALVMAVAIGGCAAQSTPPAPATGMYGDSTASVGDAYGTGAAPHTSARPRLGDFVRSEDVRDIHFDFDSYEVRTADVATLDASLQWLKAHPDSLLVIEGHADERGTTEYNLALGERRAKASMNYLVSRGIHAGRITVVSYGEERAACREHSEGCWSRNRRAHFLVNAR